MTSYKTKTLLGAMLLSASLATTATQAAVINGATSGLADPDSLITFDEVALTEPDAVTNQYAAFGATFDNLNYREDANRANSISPFLGAFSFNRQPVQRTIFFNEVASDASFAFFSNAGSASFTSLLDGVVVETFSASIAFMGLTGAGEPNFFGFSDSMFDEIQIVASGSTGQSLDNLSFNTADISAVPLPAGLPLLAVGLGVFGLVRRRQSDS